MDSRKYVFRQTGVVALGQALCVGLMIGIFALLGRFSLPVVLGGVFGGILAVANFFFMAVGATLAADKAENQDVKGGKSTIQLSYMLRLILLFVILFALVKSGLCDVFTVVLPLAFTRPILSVSEFFRKPGDTQA